VDDYADSVHLFVQTLGVKHASVIGHSMGGAIAQTLALRQPRWLTGVVLVGTGARLRVNPLILEGLRSASSERSPTDSPTESFEASVEMICQWAYGPTVSEQILRKGRQQLLTVDPNVIYGDYIACDNFDEMDRVKEIRLPTLVIFGTADQMTPPQYGLYLHEEISNAQLVEVAGAGHMVAVERPNEVSHAVARFLTML
jgi:pimeloyl-ACP methyl ester carboxylesterase